MALPDTAQQIVDRILAFLDEAQSLGLDAIDGSEESYALRMTRDRYLPETLDAYERIPATARSARAGSSDKTPDEELAEQLTILERATAQRLSRAADQSRTSLSANGRFLIERLGSVESLPEAPEPTRTAVTATRFVAALSQGAAKKRDLLNQVAAKLYAAFPLMVEVDRGMFGSGPARRVAITVPLGNDRLRYCIELERDGEIETTCAKIVRGIVIRTERVPFEQWGRALYEDLNAYARSSVQTQETLTHMLR